MLRIVARSALRALPALLLASAVFPAAFPAGGAAGEPDAALAGSNPACPDREQAAGQAAGRFVDIDGDDVHAANIGCIAYYRVTVGVGDGTRYAPGLTVTRWQMALFLIRAADRAGIAVPRPQHSPFADIGGKSASVQAGINAAVEMGVMRSVDSTARFDPDGAVTRGDMAVFLARLLDLTTDSGAPIRVAVADNGRVDLFLASGGRIEIDDSFPDSLTEATLEQEYAIEAMYELGVASGRADGTYDPNGQVTRAQMASFLIRTLGHTAVRPNGPVTLAAPPTTTTTATATTLAAALPPDPDGVYTGDPLRLIAHAAFARAYSLPGSAGDKFEVWLCNTPWIGYYSENPDHLHNPSNYSDKFAAQVQPWFRWLSGGLYTPSFVPGGAVTVGLSRDYFRSCYGEVLDRYSGGNTDIDGVVIVVGVSAGESVLGKAGCGFFSQRSFPGNRRAVFVNGNAFIDPTVLAHEMGHALCWPHSYSGETSYRGQVWQYDNPMDIMGAPSPGRSAPLPGLGTPAVNRYAAGWIPPSQTAVHTPGTTARYTLEPIGSDGLQLLIVPYEAGDRSRYRALGVRVEGEGDLWWADADIIEEGVEIYHVDQSVYGCDLPDRGYCHGLYRRTRPLFERDDGYAMSEAAHVLQPGGWWRWPGGDRIEVISRDGNAFVVEVQPDEEPPAASGAAAASVSGAAAAVHPPDEVGHRVLAEVDWSTAGVKRIWLTVSVEAGAAKDRLGQLGRRLAAEYRLSKGYQALRIRFVHYPEEPSAALGDWIDAPFGDWERAGEASAGDYSNHQAVDRTVEKDWSALPTRAQVDLYRDYARYRAGLIDPAGNAPPDSEIIEGAAGYLGVTASQIREAVRLWEAWIAE